MEQTPNMSLEDDDIQICPDLNCDDGAEVTRQPSSTTKAEIEFSSLTIEEMESRLEVGKSVENELVAYGMYCMYAHAKGFSVRKGNIERFRDGSEIRAKDYVCSSQGSKDEKSSLLNVPAYVKPTQRCNCKAKIRVARLKGQSWRVTAFKKEHTHDMCLPSQTYMLRSARHVSPDSEKCIELMVKCGIHLSDAYDVMQTMVHGRENVGFTQKDAYDSLSRARRERQIDRCDVDELVDHFMNLTNKEPYFYWDVERDEDKRLVNFFFRDYKCKIHYENFGDVLSFDSTYKTNKYNLVCCPFVGINHHFKNIMFGCAFLSNETESSFEWLFRTFLKSMGGKQPETIFTDQCGAMMKAIKTVFPDSYHRLCHWHINKNAPSYFGSLNNDTIFKNLWQKCMTNCGSVEEFEEVWKQMNDQYNIEEINWFNIMYDLRHKWATAFSCHRFSAGLNATSRSEGTNAALKRKFGGPTSTLYNCVLDYEKVQESWRLDEIERDMRSHHGKLPVGKNPWLIHAAELYTLEVFALFQQQEREMSELFITSQHEVGGTSLMRFTMIYRVGNSDNFTVEFDSQTLCVSCSCHKFETWGILCSHALKVFERVNLNYIPEKYIKKRLTRCATNIICDEGGSSCSDNNKTFDMVFVNKMVRKSYDLAIRAQSHKGTKLMMQDTLEGFGSKLNNWFENMSTHEDDMGVTKKTPQANDLRNPQLARVRGSNKSHWDVKGKKRKGKVQMAKRILKNVKRRGRNSQAAGDLQGVGAINVQRRFEQSFIAAELDINQSPYVMSVARGNLQESSYNFVYPPQEPFITSQSSGACPLQPSSHSLGAIPFATQLLATQHPWSTTMPFNNDSLF